MDQSFLAGALGAVLYEASRWIGLRFDDQLPAYLYRVHYWILTLVFIAVGGILAFYLEPETSLQALCIGIAAPSILSRLERITPETIKMGTNDSKPPATFREWLKS